MVDKDRLGPFELRFAERLAAVGAVNDALTHASKGSYAMARPANTNFQGGSLPGCGVA